jgi:hypothetical protein
MAEPWEAGANRWEGKFGSERLSTLAVLRVRIGGRRQNESLRNENPEKTRLESPPISS